MAAALRTVRTARVLAVTAVVVGALLALVGVVFAVSLGPAGRVEASAPIDSPGVILVDKAALRASSAPVHVVATPTAGGRITAIRMLQDDAHAALDASRHTLVDGVAFLPRGLRTTEQQDGSLPQDLNTDTFLDPAATTQRVDVEVAPSRLAQALVIFPGSPDAPDGEAVELTMSWENAAWFWESVALALVGIGLALGGLRAGGGAPGRHRTAAAGHRAGAAGHRAGAGGRR